MRPPDTTAVRPRPYPPRFLNERNRTPGSPVDLSHPRPLPDRFQDRVLAPKDSFVLRESHSTHLVNRGYELRAASPACNADRSEASPKQGILGFVPEGPPERCKARWTFPLAFHFRGISHGSTRVLR